MKQDEKSTCNCAQDKQNKNDDINKTTNAQTENRIPKDQPHQHTTVGNMQNDPNRNNK